MAVQTRSPKGCFLWLLRAGGELTRDLQDDARALDAASAPPSEAHQRSTGECVPGSLQALPASLSLLRRFIGGFSNVRPQPVRLEDGLRTYNQPAEKLSRRCSIAEHARSASAQVLRTRTSDRATRPANSRYR